jgi:7-carboxy-7-deazaguanine synthase
MRIIEIFKSIQCEGMLTGRVSLFIRFVGCNLNCRWCDEKSSSVSHNGFEISLNELIERIKSYSCKNIVVTGGEPLLTKEIVTLTKNLKKNGFHITVETNGTIIKDVAADLMSISPKLSHSEPIMNQEQLEKYKKKRININVLKYYTKNYNHQLKFVVEKEKDFEEIEEILNQLGIHDKRDILIMSLASSRKELYNTQKKIVNLCIKKGYRYANRLQLQIWGKNKENKNL